jgi:PAS domain S-box-containing protein
VGDAERPWIVGGRRSEHQQLHHLLAHVPAVLYVLKIEGQNLVPVLVSENIERLLGVTVAESMSYKWWVDSLHPDDRDRAVGVMTEAVKGDGYAMEYRLRHKDGSYHWVEDKNRVVRDTAGKPQQMVGVWTGITERKRNEEQLREQAEIINRAHDAIIIRNFDDLRIVFWNKGAEQLYGWSAEERVGLSEVTTLADPGQTETLMSALRTTGEFRGELKQVTKDGTELVADVRETLVRDSDGTPRSILIICTDITKRKQAEERLREQADIINRAQDAVIVRDFTTDLITVWNSGAERLYGWSANEAIGRPIQELIFAEPNDRKALLKQLVSAGEFHGEIKHRARDGREVIVDSRSTLIRNDDGTPRAVLGINTDVTEKKKVEKHLLRTQRLESIGTLASGVAHDLNNVLVPILMAVPILRSDPTPEESENFLNTIESSAARGADIVKQVLTFARGAGGDRVLLQPIYLLEEIAKIAKQTFPKTVRLRTSYAEDLRLLEGDPTQLHQVLLNLCLNARDAMPEGGTLSLTAENFDVDEQYATMTPGLKAGPHVLISVIDTGTGIAQDIVEKIFDPFFTTKETGMGTGLGLSSALGIVRSHGGVIRVYSAANGTTFRVFLPSTAGVFQADEAKAQMDVPTGHGETILIVDDELAIREVAKVVLSKSGYKVLAADDGPSALALFMEKSKEIDVVLTDVVMPIMSGLVLARTLRKMDVKAKVIVSSARDSDYNPGELTDIGVQGCLNKPYSRATLLRAVDRVLHNDEENKCVD